MLVPLHNIAAANMQTPNPRTPSSQPDLGTLQWQDFESLCEALLRKSNPDATFVNLNRPGMDQRGADLLIVYPTYKVGVEFKHAEATPASLNAWASAFDWKKECREFMIIASAKRDPRVTPRYFELREDFASQGIEFTFNQQDWIFFELAKYPEVAAQFFGQAWGLEFRRRNAQALELAEVEERRKVVQKGEFSNFYYYENGLLDVRLNLPGENRRAIDALFIFKEPGMYRSMITLGNDALLDAFDASAWHGARPFVVGSIESHDILQVGNVRLVVTKAAADCLAYALHDLAGLWHQRINSCEGRREAIGYRRVADGFVIGSMRRNAWDAVVAFAANSLQERESSARHISIPKECTLIVSSKGDNGVQDVDHVVLAATPDDVGVNEIQLRWRDPLGIYKNDTCVESGYWGVQSSVEWIERELLPTVWAWAHGDRGSRWRQFWLRPRALPAFDLATVWRRCKDPLLTQCLPEKQAELQMLTSELQRHYHLRSHSTFSAEMGGAVDAALLTAFEGATLDHLGYFAENAQLTGGSQRELLDSLRRRTNASMEPISGLLLDWRLRALDEVCLKNKVEFSGGRVNRIVQELMPIIMEADAHSKRLRHRIDRSFLKPAFTG